MELSLRYVLSFLIGLFLIAVLFIALQNHASGLGEFFKTVI